jgi:hypothetical protein
MVAPRPGTDLAFSMGMTTTTHDSVKPILSLSTIAFLTAAILALLALAIG